MSWTKTQYHEEICAQMGDANEEQFHYESNEPETDSEFRLAHDGYQEFYCYFCGNFHADRKCETAEQYRAQMIDEDLPY